MLELSPRIQGRKEGCGTRCNHLVLSLLQCPPVKLFPTLFPSHAPAS